MLFLRPLRSYLHDSIRRVKSHSQGIYCVTFVIVKYLMVELRESVTFAHCVLYCIIRNITLGGYLQSCGNIYDMTYGKKYTYIHIYVYICK